MRALHPHESLLTREIVDSPTARYRVLRAIGRGGMGAVFEAVSERDGARVAIKQILSDHSELKKAFAREIRLLVALRHPNLPKVVDHFENEAGQFLVMDYVPGDDLGEQLLRRGTAFHPDEALRWADQLLDALEYLHSSSPPVIHRDIKPQNVKLNERGEVILLDFGLAKGTAAYLQLTSYHSIQGYTPHYAPPEQMRGEEISPCSDLYALAATLYDLMTGVKPPNALTRAMAAVEGERDPLQSAQELNPQISPAVADVLQSALSLSVRDRPATARTMRMALHAASSAQGTVVVLPGTRRQRLPTDHKWEAGASAFDGRPGNLPAQATSFIGRGRELTALLQLARSPDVRLITLTGAAGTGKTRLGLEVAVRLRNEFQDGVFLASLASVQRPELVMSAIAQVVSAKETGDRPLLEQLQISLRDKQLLLLVDNFEHVVSAAPVVAELLSACPELKVLATSREVLRLRGEHEFLVPPLAVPDPADSLPLTALSQYTAIALFVGRAAAVQQDFILTDENAPIVAEICSRLDGLPLAIELAAARIKVLSPQAMLARLQDRFNLLHSGARDLPARHRTLREAINGSYNLLDQAEQRLIRQLSLFVGGCSVFAAEAILDFTGAPRSGGDKPDVLDGLESLLDKSLLQRVEGVDGEPRFIMLETIREYAWEQLTSHAEVEKLRRRYVQHYLEWAETAESELVGPNQVDWYERLDAESGNLHSVVEWALATGSAQIALRLGVALWRFWFVRGYLKQGRRWLESALRLEPASTDEVDAFRRLRAKALAGLGYLARMQCDYDCAVEVLQESLALQRELGSSHEVALVLNLLGTVAEDQGEYTRAVELLEDSVALFRQVGDGRGVGIALNNLANVSFSPGNYDRAAALYEEALALQREAGHWQGVAGTLNNLGNLANFQGDHRRAEKFHAEGLELRRQLRDKLGIAMSLCNLGNVLLAQGELQRAIQLQRESLDIRWELADMEGIAECFEGLVGIAVMRGEPERAVWLAAAAHRLRDAIGNPLPAARRVAYDEYLTQACSALGRTAFEADWGEGQAMTTRGAVRMARKEG